MAIHPKERRSVRADALERAAEILGSARLPVIGGLLTDIAGAEAAIALAHKLDGVVDHAAGEGLSRATQMMREVGGCPASLGEARNRADFIVLVGESPLERDPHLLDRLFPKEEGLPRPGNNPRELVLLGGDKAKIPAHAGARAPVTEIATGVVDLRTLVSMLSAALRGRQVSTEDGEIEASLMSLAERLLGGAFPVFVISPCDLEEQVLRAVLGMVHHLCVTARAATLSLPAPGNGDGVNLCSAWTCGLPVRTRFTHGLPEHDPWRYGARRLIESGEADALLWVGALATSGIERPHGVPTVVLSASGDAAASGDIVIEVGRPGRDHDAELYLSEIAGIGRVKAAKPSQAAPTVAAVITGIAERIGSREARAW
jgi:formylmethanofuran dehydrogenase subunit B